jgi:hypothetical protein
MGNRVSEWKLDEGSGTTTADTVGTNNGILTNFNFSGSSNWKTGAECVSGSCLSFDGINDYISIPWSDNYSFGEGNFTLEVWFKTPIAHDGTIHCIRDYVGGTGKPVIALGVKSDNTLEAILRDDDSGAYYKYSTSKYLVEAWNHAVLVRISLTDFSFYLNGQNAGNFNIAGLDNLTPITTQPITIGTHNYGGSSSVYFNGKIDEARIYNAALTASAIRDQYVAGLDKLLANSQITNEDYQQRLADLNSSYAIDK